MSREEQKMNKNSSGNSFLVLIVVLVLLALIGSCSNSDDDYKNILESGQKKYYTGQAMTKQEYDAVKSFNNWKSKQGQKTYSDWGG